MSAFHLLEQLRAHGVVLHVDGASLRYRAPRGVLTPDLLAQIRDHKPDLLRILRETTPTSARATPVDRFPLSQGQRALWFLQQRNPQSAAYHVAFATRILSRVRSWEIESCFQYLVDRHPSLRATYLVDGGEPCQRIAPHLDLVLETVDASGRDLPDLHGQVMEAYRRPFDLEHGPLIRVSLFSRNPEDHVLLLTIHHIACDGWSMWLLQDEFGEVYRAHRAKRAPALMPLRHSYADFVKWQSERLESVQGAADWDYWREQLSGPLPSLELPWDQPRPPIQRDLGACRSFSLSASLTAKIRAYAKRSGATLYAVLVAAFQVLLHRYTGQRDVVLGTPTGGRSRTEFQDLVGFFVNPVVLRGDLTGDPSFDEHVDRVRRVILAALDHQDFPFPVLVSRLQADRDLSRAPIFQVLFALQRPQMHAAVEALVAAAESTTRIAWDDLVLEPFEIPQQEGQFDFSLEMLESRRTLSGVFKYNTDLLDRATVERARNHFQTLLEDIVDHSNRRVSELALLDEHESRSLLYQRNDTATEYPYAACIHELFEQLARTTPDAVAAEFQGESLTYAELNDHANRVAHLLLNRNLGSKLRIGVCVTRCLDMLVGVLGVLKSGGAYVPLDPECPQQRLTTMLRECRVKAVLTTAQHADLFRDSTGTVLCLDALAEELAAQPTGRLPDGLSSAGDCAYVMFTSGSTGQPKGVAVPHRGVVRLVRSTNYARFSSDEVWLQIAPLSFDGSTLEIWGALLNGGKLVIAPAGPLSLEQLGHVVKSGRVTSMLLTAGLFHQQVDFGLADFASVRQLFAGGDVLSASHVRRAVEQLPGCLVINAYGPTENTTISTSYPLTSPADVGHAVSIGRPISNTRVYVLDAHLEPVPEGVAGELYVAGDGLALGYVNHPDWTAERFVPDRFSVAPGARMYKTGDRARWRADGNLDFLGRLDHQVKVRGFRIEPKEIESALTAADGVRDAVVVVHGDPQGEKRLIAYLAAEQPSPGAPDTLRRVLRQRLPECMIPSQFIVLDALPLNVNGKVDRAALPAPDQTRPQLEQAFVAPQTPTEHTLAGIWRSVLGIGTVGRHDNFFALGGHSLLATQVVSRVKQQWRVDLPLVRMFDHSTIAELSALIDDTARPDRLGKPAIEPAERTADIPLSFAQERLWILNQLEPDHAFYNVPAAVRIRGALDPTVLEQCLVALVRRHESLRTTFDTIRGRAVQRIAAEVAVALPTIDLTRLPVEEREAAVGRHSQEDASRPFDLSAGPLFRFRLLRVDDAEFVFLLTLHHIIADGWSMGVLVSELMELYRSGVTGTPLNLPPLPIQYADFAVWQRRYLTEAVHEKHLEYWRGQLQGLPVLQLPIDHPRPAVQTFAGGTRSIRLADGTVQALETLSHHEDATLYMALLAAFQVLMARSTGQTDVAVGAGIANRNRPELERLIGFFVNLQVMRCRIDGQRSFRDLLREVRQTCLDAYAHQDLPFDSIVRELQPDRQSNYNPLCRVCMVYQNFPMPDLELPELSFLDVNVVAGTAKFDLTLYLKPGRDGLSAEIEYNTDLFDPGTIERMLRHFAALLRSIAEAPDRPISELELLERRERDTLLVEWARGNRVDDPAYGLVHQRCEAQAARTPHAPAIVCGDEALSYAQLDRRADCWARHLRRLGVDREKRVAICIERSPGLVMGMLAILKAGGAYVSLDPNYPPDRLAFMLRDSGATLLLTTTDLRPRLPIFAGHVVYSDTLPQAGQDAGDRIECVNQPSDLAYVIYTSGSTGTPKAVALEHAGVSNLMASERRLLELGPSDRVLQFASASFDASVWEIFGALGAGAALHLVPREAMLPDDGLIAWMEREAITVATLPPSVLAALPDADLPHLRVVVSAGEQCDRSVIRRWRKGRRFINAYGPTEGSVCATLTDCDPDEPCVSIGSPIDNVQAFVLDRWLQPVSVGVVGELYIGGAGLARGYLNRPDLTAASFVPNPFGHGGSRLYKTGDRVRWLPDGRLQFHGRFDQQVKIRGFRIELQEIESVLQQHPEVRDAAVVAATDGRDHHRLFAHVVSRTPTSGTSSPHGSWKEERVQQWRELYDDNYRQAALASDPTFNITGWEDSYTGEPLPPETMREWVETTVQRVRAWQPQRVLEVGVGSGLLLFPIAPHCEEYVGTDLSRVAIEHVRGHLRGAGLSDKVKLKTLPAHELGQLPPRSYDTVILNSVVQYFPDVDYLVDVLADAAERVSDGGRMFVGDVRCLPLLDVFHASVEIAHATDQPTREVLRRRVEERRLHDQELVIDPRFFFALKARVPRISHAEVLLKRGRISSELTKYRYDVVLHVDRIEPAPAGGKGHRWGQDFRCLDDVEQALRNEPSCLHIGGMPNARLTGDLAVHRWLHANGDALPLEALREAPASVVEAGIDPETIWELGETHGYDVAVTWSMTTMDGSIDAFFRRRDTTATSQAYEPLMLHPEHASDQAAWRSYANDPMTRRRTQDLVGELRGWLRDRLPDYMIPSGIHVLDAMPLTPSGKVDKRALLETGQRPVLADQRHRGPRDDLERGLAAAWSEVLGIESVGIDDNFFELGGDSILGIQVVSRIKAQGLSCSPLQLFQHQTIAELAGVVGRVEQSHAEQGEVSGPVELTPIQHWFFDQQPVRPHHFNQSLLLETDCSLNLKHLEAVLEHLLDHHDALRLRFQRHDGHWRATHAPGSSTRPKDVSSPYLELLDLSGVSDTQMTAAIESACVEAQSGLCLEAGPMIRAIHMSLGPTRNGRLLLVVHHLVVDAVSWAILLQDLATAYREVAAGRPITLPAKTTSFQAWSRRLHQMARSESPELAAMIRNSMAAPRAEPFPRCYDRGLNTVASCATLSMTLDPTETKRLLEQAASVHRVRVDEILLAAFGLAYRRWCGRERVAIDLESHGRENLCDNVDLSRTVGWFTSLAPIVLDVPSDGEPTDLIAAVQHQVRADPHRGIHFGLLRYLGDEQMRRELAALDTPDVAFNYLGRIDRLVDTHGGPFSLAAEAVDAQRCPEATRRHVLEFNSSITDDRLRVDWIYSRNLHTEARAAALVTCFREALGEILCCGPRTRQRPHLFDYPWATITQSQLDRLTSQNRDLEDVYDATPTQAGILFHALASPRSGVYVMQLSGRLDGMPEVEAFEQAWLEVIRRHPILRTSFWWADVQTPLQLVHRDARLQVQRNDWRKLSTIERDNAFERFLQEDRKRELDLAFGPLMRLTFMHLGENEYRFVWTHHHLLLDGWSLPVVIRDLVEAFGAGPMDGSGESATLPRFRDYVAWLRGQDVAAATTFWKGYLAGFTAPTSLGIDRDGYKPGRTVLFDQRVIRVPAVQTHALKAMARSGRVTLNTVLQGVWALLLSRYSGQSDVVFGTTVSGRSAPIAGIEAMVGMLINTLPVRIAVSGDQRWLPWLASLQRQQVAVREHEHTALTHIQEISDVPRGSPLFESLLVFENYPVDDSLLGDLGRTLSVRDLRFDESTHYSLALTIDPGPELRIRVGFDAERFEASAIERMTTHIESILSQVIADPDKQIADISILSAAERRQLTLECNRTAAEYPRDRTLTELFEAVAARVPERVAITVDGRDFSYAMLNQHASRFARRLQALGVQPADLVGICMQRSWGMMVALLGVLKAGGAYVPLDPSFPDERLRFALEDAHVRVLVTEGGLVESYRGFAPVILSMDGETSPPTGDDEDLLPPPSRANDLAYVIYTSGSTGRPKGVQIAHRALVNFLTSMQSTLEITSADTLLAVTTVSFDIAALELFLPLIAGARVVIAGSRQASDGMQLRDLLEKSEATIMQATPATWRIVLQAGWQGDPRLQILVGGEALETKLARQLAGMGRSLWNLYGPTESTIWSTAARLKPGLTRVTIGKPIANTQVYLLDAQLQNVPVGVPGELYIAGDGLARGYLNRCELTASRFVPNPHGSPAGERMYRTGDLCRWLPDGTLEFLGRMDHQVKVRGYRIELGEIEGLLALHPAIEEAAVSVWRDAAGEPQLVAYVRPVANAEPTVGHLRGFLRSRLPDYMVPATFVVLDNFPRTTNGKFDRKALPAPTGERPDLERPYVAPRTPLEASLAIIWSEVLGIETVGIHDNFFDLGGASMNALRIVARARMDGIVPDVSLFKPELMFEHPTIAAWAALIEEQ